MISCLKGELFHKSLEKVTILVNGVGYEVFLSTASLEKLPQLGEEVFLYTYTYVREDILTLFGFVDQDEKKMFLLLINVSGVGPKLALSVLSGIRPSDLARAIATKVLFPRLSISVIRRAGHILPWQQLKDVFPRSLLLKCGLKN
jgi:Holliday junction DNA helicase RuvA